MASHKQHKDSNLKMTLWREVAASILPNVNGEVALELIQKCWKSLRDKFRRTFNGRMLSQKSGAGADDVESVDTAWPYFELLLFLRDTMVTRPSGRPTQPLARFVLAISRLRPLCFADRRADACPPDEVASLQCPNGSPYSPYRFS
ncbi:hypothetical protein HPB49_003589 [Dermacentor silvarum]|uniref:Uncharacterized protein n=1 Tax=Dermacentor silvarum TaxID=543639 RepID=A0ACB8DTX9_DERSI|nr:hypothetical protein HPB49_003589 [Dermacentor silvarum]